MKNLTDQLVEDSKGILNISPESTDIRYSKFDDGGVETEIGMLLYAFVLTIKPQYILETGCYTGISAMYMGQALKENKTGRIRTLEISPEHKERAEKLWKSIGLEEYIQCILQDSLNFEPSMPIDFLFLDSEPGIRFAELVKFYPYLKEGGYVFIHDLPPTFCQGNINPDHPEFKDWPFGTVPDEMKALIKEDKLRPFSFPSPRGFVGFYKPRKEDYKV